MCNAQLLEPYSLQIPSESPLRRDAARPQHLQDSSYAPAYDDKTIFFDMAWEECTLVCVGPPLFNLEQELLNGIIYFDQNIDTPAEFTISHHDRSHVTRIDLPANQPVPSTLSIQFASGQQICVPVPQQRVTLFDDLTTLVTVQRNEDLTHIHDWLTYYHKVHNVQGVLVFDNGSTEYSIAQLMETLASVNGITSVAVVKWDFPYGPQGTLWDRGLPPWDSDFCQIGALQSARYSYLAYADLMINDDIDELLIPLTDKTLLETARDSETGTVFYSGYWVENVIDEATEFSSQPRFWDFSRVGAVPRPSQRKWALIPRKLSAEQYVNPHSVSGTQGSICPDFSLAHFEGINSGWKIADRHQPPTTSTDEALYPELVAQLMNVFPEQYQPQRLTKLLTKANIPDIAGVTRQWILRTLSTQTCDVITWHKLWIWRNYVVVLEAESPMGDIAYECSLDRGHIVLAVSARDNTKVEKLHERLQKMDWELENLPGKMGFVVSKDQTYPAGTFDSNDEWANTFQQVAERIVDIHLALSQ